jgi:hypothetical protein
VALDRLENESVELLRHVRRDLARRPDGRLERRRGHRRFVGALKQPDAGERLPEDDARGEHVGPSRHLAAEELLRRHVGDFALELPVARGGEPPVRLGDAEIEQA